VVQVNPHAAAVKSDNGFPVFFTSDRGNGMEGVDFIVDKVPSGREMRAGHPGPRAAPLRPHISGSNLQTIVYGGSLLGPNAFQPPSFQPISSRKSYTSVQ